MKKIIVFFLSCIFAFATETTMCFKQNWAFLADIDNTALDGGNCKGIKSAEQMKKDGWIIVDIRVTPAKIGMDYLYIFKKNDVAKEESGDKTKLALGKTDLSIHDELLRQIETRKQEKEKKEQEEQFIKQGGAIYQQSCVNCHGEKGESTAYNTSRALNTMSEEDIVSAIRGYNLNDYDKGMAYLMSPYASFISKEDAIAISRYLKSINVVKK